MAGSFQTAGQDVIRRLAGAMEGVAREIMVESIQECPISGPETYVPQFRQIDGRPVHVGDDPEMIGDNGTLRRSARIFAPRNDGATIELEMGYGFGEEVNPAGDIAAQYAVIVHERSDVHHEPPTKSHYLLDPVLAHAGEYGGELERRMLAGGPFPAEVPYGTVIADGTDLGAE